MRTMNTMAHCPFASFIPFICSNTHRYFSNRAGDELSFECRPMFYLRLLRGASYLAFHAARLLSAIPIAALLGPSPSYRSRWARSAAGLIRRLGKQPSRQPDLTSLFVWRVLGKGRVGNLGVGVWGVRPLRVLSHWSPELRGCCTAWSARRNVGEAPWLPHCELCP